MNILVSYMFLVLIAWVVLGIFLVTALVFSDHPILYNLLFFALIILVKIGWNHLRPWHRDRYKLRWTSIR